MATDLYEGVWQQVQGREGDPNVLRNPEAYAPFPVSARSPDVHADGRPPARIRRDGTFDLAYSLSSIEHFGGVENAAATLREMGRVLRPGGIVALATEYVLEGPPHEETFQPAEFMQLIDQPGLELVEPIDTGVYRRYAFTAGRSLRRSLRNAPHAGPVQRHRVHDGDGVSEKDVVRAFRLAVLRTLRAGLRPALLQDRSKPQERAEVPVVRPIHRRDAARSRRWSASSSDRRCRRTGPGLVSRPAP